MIAKGVDKPSGRSSAPPSTGCQTWQAIQTTAIHIRTPGGYQVKEKHAPRPVMETLQVGHMLKILRWRMLTGEARGHASSDFWQLLVHIPQVSAKHAPALSNQNILCSPRRQGKSPTPHSTLCSTLFSACWKSLQKPSNMAPQTEGVCSK